ncbi:MULTISPECIES: hypothetical protein [unclassified Salinivibrio]|uniref:hypothetical protein n=1 Tax=unclassified Salinivibrio TaxID=2636825 RepID=UPI00098592CE|nr:MULTISPECIES: hypothetical protein [unclassified Salinivibrio]OOF13991.1 hypothetical protein BZG83_07005 [Salinivibrio sp. PR919]OOF19013.1 hypothetical protein BZG84_02105 [Salinivibrio sp. PR932]
MLIRSEAPADLVRLDQWWRDTLANPQQADQLQQWREHGLITLSLVATDDMGSTLGHIAVVDAQSEDNAQLIAVWFSPDPELIAPLLDEAESVLFELGYCQLKIAPSPQAANAEFAPISTDKHWWYKQLAAATV